MTLVVHVLVLINIELANMHGDEIKIVPQFIIQNHEAALAKHGAITTQTDCE